MQIIVPENLICHCGKSLMVNISNLSTSMLNFKTHISTTFLLSGTKNFWLLQEDIGYGRKIKKKYSNCSK